MKEIITLIFVSLTVFGLRAQAPEQIYEAMPTLDGWSKSAKYEIFHRDNLFDRINGSAPLFLEFNFEEMTALELSSDLNDADYLTIQVYRHATAQDAFGMYASERSTDLPYYNLGVEAQGDNRNMYFVSGPLYVKIWVSGDFGKTDNLVEYATAFCDNLQQSTSYPEKFRFLPEENKMTHTEIYVPSNYMGHTFLKNVYASDYQQGEKRYQLFVIDAGTPDQAVEILKRYYEFTKQPVDITEGFMTMKDKYNGDVLLYWKEGYIVGSIGEIPENVDMGKIMVNIDYH